MPFSAPVPDIENRTMEISQIIPHIESLIFAADKPLPLLEILDLLNNALAFLEDRATLEQVEAALEAIKEKYSTEFYAFEVKESGGGYQFLTKKEYYQTVAQLNGDKFLKRLSTAALETLAIVAYKQPISKGEIEHIRGVSTDYSIQKLLEKELIVITGRSETLPGKPLLYATSKAFMDYFGLNSPKDLPKLKEVFDDETIQPTLIGLENSADDQDGRNMIVSETGELVEQDTDGEGPQSSLNGHTALSDDTDIPVADEEDQKPSVQQAKLFLPFGDEEIPVTNDIEETEEEKELPAIEDTESTTTATQDDNDDVVAATDIPTIDEALSEEEAAAEDHPSTTDEPEEAITYATDEELAAFMQSAADVVPNGDDDEEDDEDEDDEHDEDEEDEDENQDEEGEDDEDDEDSDDDGDDEDWDDEDEDDEDGEDDEDNDNEDDDTDSGKKDDQEVGPTDDDIEADFDGEDDFDEDDDFNVDDEDEEDDEDNKR